MTYASVMVLSLGLSLGITAQEGSAQSYDCKKAATATENAICNNRSLSNLDQEMATLYWVVEQIPAMMGMRGEYGDEARAFLKERDACGAGETCLTKVYTKRNSALKQDINDSMADYCKAIGLC